MNREYTYCITPEGNLRITFEGKWLDCQGLSCAIMEFLSTRQPQSKFTSEDGKTINISNILYEYIKYYTKV